MLSQNQEASLIACLECFCCLLFTLPVAWCFRLCVSNQIMSKEVRHILEGPCVIGSTTAKLSQASQ